MYTTTTSVYIEPEVSTLSQNLTLRTVIKYTYHFVLAYTLLGYLSSVDFVCMFRNVPKYFYGYFLPCQPYSHCTHNIVTFDRLFSSPPAEFIASSLTSPIAIIDPWTLQQLALCATKQKLTKVS